MIRACSKCGDITKFPENHPSRRGYWCNKCKSAYNTENAKVNRETKRRNNNAWQSRNSANRSERTAKYRGNNPLAYEAHKAVAREIRAGRMVRGICEVCGFEKTHAHHDNYLEQLSVRWLCHKHHMEEHINMLEARKK